MVILMILQWCLKGIPEIQAQPGQAGFSDTEARNVLDHGIPSEYVRRSSGQPFQTELSDAYRRLGQKALDDHVNAYANVAKTTPYISLSAGIVVPSTWPAVMVRRAWQTATDFATRGGQSRGYVFRLWCIVAPKSAASIPGVADEVRDLNIYTQFGIYHTEGEVAAKIMVPARQIECVFKIDQNLQPIGFNGLSPSSTMLLNKDFVKPETITNLREEIS